MTLAAACLPYGRIVVADLIYPASWTHSAGTITGSYWLGVIETVPRLDGIADKDKTT